jgi:hypothetical protein
VGVVKGIPREDLPGNHERQRHDEPRKYLAYPGADFVDRQQEFLHIKGHINESAIRFRADG